MKKFIYKLVIPLTIISFITFTKWWYVLPIDAPHSIMIGFPLVYSSEGWHTSMSQQFFIFEFLIDFFVYFLFWTLIIYCINRFIYPIKFHKLINLILITLTTILLFGSLLVVFLPENVFYLKRDFEIQTIETKYKFILQDITRPELNENFKE